MVLRTVIAIDFGLKMRCKTFEIGRKEGFDNTFGVLVAASECFFEY